MKLSRRKFTAGGAIVLTGGLAGCTSDSETDSENTATSEPTPEPTPEPTTDDVTAEDLLDDEEFDTSDDDSGMEQIDSFNRNYSIEEDNWKGRELRFTSEGRLEYEGIVRDGPAVDFYLMDADEYEHFENGERFQYLTATSRQDTTGADVSATVPAGNYVFLVDNSEMGEAAPPSDFDNNIASVEVSLTMYE